MSAQTLKVNKSPVSVDTEYLQSGAAFDHAMPAFRFEAGGGAVNLSEFTLDPDGATFGTDVTGLARWLDDGDGAFDDQLDSLLWSGPHDLGMLWFYYTDLSPNGATNGRTESGGCAVTETDSSLPLGLLALALFLNAAAFAADTANWPASVRRTTLTARAASILVRSRLWYGRGHPCHSAFPCGHNLRTKPKTL